MPNTHSVYQLFIPFFLHDLCVLHIDLDSFIYSVTQRLFSFLFLFFSWLLSCFFHPKEVGRDKEVFPVQLTRLS